MIGSKVISRTVNVVKDDAEAVNNTSRYVCWVKSSAVDGAVVLSNCGPKAGGTAPAVAEVENPVKVCDSRVPLAPVAATVTIVQYVQLEAAAGFQVLDAVNGTLSIVCTPVACRGPSVRLKVPATVAAAGVPTPAKHTRVACPRVPK